jgi:hypothetical protein
LNLSQPLPFCYRKNLRSAPASQPRLQVDEAVNGAAHPVAAVRRVAVGQGRAGTWRRLTIDFRLRFDYTSNELMNGYLPPTTAEGRHSAETRALCIF